MADEPQPQEEKSVVLVRGAVLMRGSNGRIMPGSSPSFKGAGGGRKKGGSNAVRGWMKEEYAEYCERMGPRANLLLFYEEVRTNEELPINIRLDAAKALDRIVFPAQALAVAEKSPVSDEKAERGKKLVEALKSAFTMLEAPPDE